MNLIIVGMLLSVATLLGIMFLADMMYAIFLGNETPKAIFGVVLALSLMAAVLVLWKRMIFSGEPILEFPGSEELDDRLKRQMSTILLALISLSVLTVLVTYFSPDSFHGWAAFGGSSIGLGLLVVSVAILQKNYTSMKRSPNRTRLESMTLSGYRRNRMIVFVGSASLCLVVIYKYMFGTAREYFSVWDLAGILFMLSSICIYYVILGLNLKK